MPRIDRSAVRTPVPFIAVALVCIVLRLGLAAFAATIKTDAHPAAWKTAAEADKDLLPGAQDVVEPKDELASSSKPRSSSAQPETVFKQTPLSNADKDAIEAGKLVLYEFVSESSDPCKNMERNALSNENIKKVIESKFVPIRVIDRVKEDGKNPKWIANLQKRYHVFALPTLIIVDSSAEQKAALIGNCSSLTVERFLNRAARMDNLLIAPTAASTL